MFYADANIMRLGALHKVHIIKLSVTASILISHCINRISPSCAEIVTCEV